MRTCYTIVSDLAVCQRCPALLLYKLHYGQKDAWQVGIKGGGYPYGKIFHGNIARVFFEAAANPRNVLHAKIARAIGAGESGLEEFVRRDIFMPFVFRYSAGMTSGQLQAMARGVSVWVRAMSEFFRSIPSLVRYPEGNMNTVFIEPEQKLQGSYELDGGKLVITGCYDALMFNPDKAEARLFEFKGYKKSDITVPLSQSLIYSWLIEKRTGIVPSVEIIYLDDEDKAPDVFSPESVRDMMGAGLPDLFASAFDVISLRRRPDILRDKSLCSVCRFSTTCRRDYDNAFMRKKRRGSSLVSVLVFLMMAVVITAQVYFFTTLSLEDGIEEREITALRIRLDRLIEDAGTEIKEDRVQEPTTSITASYDTFYDKTQKRIYSEDASTHWGIYDVPDVLAERKMYAHIHNLNYTFSGDNPGSNPIPMHKRVFAAIPPDNPYLKGDVRGTRSNGVSINTNSASQDTIYNIISADSKLKKRKYYLIRAYTKTTSNRNLLHQVLVRSADKTPIVFTSKEINDLDHDVHVLSSDIPNGISLDHNSTSLKFEPLTNMEVWY